MNEWIDIAKTGILYAALAGLGMLALIGLAVLFCDTWEIVKEKIGKSKITKAMAGIAVVCAIMYGGSKSIVTVNDPYIRDNGSYTTNDLVHIDVIKRFDFIPDDMEILIYSRELSQTNADDWVKLVRIELGEFRMYEFPLDIPFPAATGYNFMVAANYIPQPTVHTNGVLSIKGFIVPNTNLSAFPNTRSELTGDQEQ